MELGNHTVVPGDNLSKIASRYGTSVEQLRQLNPFIKDANHIQIGWNLSVSAQPGPSTPDLAGTAQETPVAVAAQQPQSNGPNTSEALVLGPLPQIPESCASFSDNSDAPCTNTFATVIYSTEERKFWLLPEQASDAIKEAIEELADKISPDKSAEDRKRGLDETGLLEYFMEPVLANFLFEDEQARMLQIETEEPHIEQRYLSKRAYALMDPRMRATPLWQEYQRLEELYREWQPLRDSALREAQRQEYTYENGTLFSKEAMEARRRVQDYLTKRSAVMSNGMLADYDVESLADTFAKAKSRYLTVQNCTKQCRGKVKSYSAFLRASRGKLNFIDYVESIIKVADYGLALPEFALIPPSEEDVNAGVIVYREYLGTQLKQQEINERLQRKYRDWVESTGSNMRPPAGLVAAERAEWEQLQQTQKDLIQRAELNIKNAAIKRHLLWEPESFQPQPADRLVRAGFPLREMSLPDNSESPVRALSLFNLEGMAEQLQKDLKTKPLEAMAEGIQRIPTDTAENLSSAKSLFEAWLENAGGYAIEDQESDWFDDDGWFEMEKFYAYLQEKKLKVNSLEDCAVRADWGGRLKQVLFSADIRDEMRLFDSSAQAQLVRCLTPPQSNIHSVASAAGPSFSVAEGLQASAQASLGIDLARGEVEIFSVDYPARSAAKEVTVHYQNHAGEMLPMSLGRYSMHLSARAWGYAGASLLLAAKMELTPNGPLWGKPALSPEEPATRPGAEKPPRKVSHSSTYTSAPVTTGRGPSVNVQDGAQASFNLFAGVQAGILLTGALNWAPPTGLAAMRTIPGREVGSVETSDANQWLSMADLTVGAGGALGLGAKANAMLSLHNGRLVLKLKASAMAGAGANGEFSFAVSYQGMVELINIYRRELHRNHGRPLDWVDPAAADLISKINVLSAVGLDAELLLGMSMWIAHRRVMQVDLIMTLYESLLSRPGRAGGIASSITEYDNAAELRKWCVEAIPAALGPLLLTLISEPLSFDAVFENSEDAQRRRTAKLDQQRAIVRILGWIVENAKINNSVPAAQHQFEEACMRMNQYGVLSENTGQAYCENRLRLDLFIESGPDSSTSRELAIMRSNYQQHSKLLGAQADLSCKRRESLLPFGSPSASYEPR